MHLIGQVTPKRGCDIIECAQYDEFTAIKAVGLEEACWICGVFKNHTKSLPVLCIGYLCEFLIKGLITLLRM